MAQYKQKESLPDEEDQSEEKPKPDTDPKEDKQMNAPGTHDAVDGSTKV